MGARHAYEQKRLRRPTTKREQLLIRERIAGVVVRMGALGTLQEAACLVPNVFIDKIVINYFLLVIA